MLALPGTVDDCWLHSDYCSGCGVLVVPGGPEGGTWTGRV